MSISITRQFGALKVAVCAENLIRRCLSVLAVENPILLKQIPVPVSREFCSDSCKAWVKLGGSAAPSAYFASCLTDIVGCD